MGTTNSSYRKEKDIENNVISIPTAALKVISDLAEKCICKIKCNTNEVATGFFCAIPYPNKYNRLPVIITNNHVLEESDITIGSNINFSLNNDSTKFTILIDNTRKVYTNVKYDITIIEIKESDKLDINSFLDIDGVRVNFDDGWALVRYSNTGPNITARFEANNEERLQALQDEFVGKINEYNN